MQRVTPAELRDHLDEYLRAVEGGETIGVWDDGRELAMILPPAGTNGGSAKVGSFGDLVRKIQADLADLPPVDVDLAMRLLREDRDYR